MIKTAAEMLAEIGDERKRVGRPPGRPTSFGQESPRCSVEKCKDAARRLTFCDNHYQRFRRHGDPLAGKPVMRKEWHCGLCGKVVKTQMTQGERMTRCPVEHMVPGTRRKCGGTRQSVTEVVPTKNRRRERGPQ